MTTYAMDRKQRTSEEYAAIDLAGYQASVQLVRDQLNHLAKKVESEAKAASTIRDATKPEDKGCWWETNKHLKAIFVVLVEKGEDNRRMRKAGYCLKILALSGSKFTINLLVYLSPPTKIG